MNKLLEKKKQNKSNIIQGMKSSFRSTRTTTTMGRKLSSIFPWKTISRSESSLSGKFDLPYFF